MLTKNKINMDKKLLIGVGVLATLFVLMLVIMKPEFAYASDLFSKGESVAGDFTEQLFSFFKVFYPLAMIVCVGLILTTRNDKKISMYWTIAGTVTLAFVVIVIIHSGIVTETLENWFS